MNQQMTNLVNYQNSYQAAGGDYKLGSGNYDGAFKHGAVINKRLDSRLRGNDKREKKVKKGVRFIYSLTLVCICGYIAIKDIKDKGVRFYFPHTRYSI
jgi:hypothetical protein